MTHGDRRCWCGAPAWLNWRPGPVPPGHPNLCKHNYVRCLIHLVEDRCPKGCHVQYGAKTGVFRAP